MKNKISIVMAGLMSVMSIASYADGAVYRLSSAPQTAADWNNAAFWGGEVPPTDGSAIVVLPSNMVARVDDAAIAMLNSYKIVRPEAGAELVIDIENDVDLACAVTADTDVRVTTGTLVKRGAGCLSLRSVWKVPYCDSDKTPYETRQWDYDVNIRIEAGALKMQERKAGPNGTEVSIHYYGDVEVCQGGVLYPGSVDPDGDLSKYNENCILRLTGSGVVTNDVASGSNCRLKPYHVGADPAVFSGRLDGKIYFYSGGHQYLTGTESELVGGGFRIYDNSGTSVRGILGVSKLGYNHEYPSSLGRYDSLSIGESGGRLLYLGTGESTIKSFLISDPGKNFPSVIDAGATGGVVFGGSIESRAENTIHRLHLDGSNTVPCQIKCSVDAKQGLCHVVKKGVGTWRMCDVNTRPRDAIAGFTLEDGTLQFESMAEKGVNCSLGACDLFAEDRWEWVTNVVAVPYCFRMGTAMTIGTLEYVGKDFFRVATRPIALSGRGRLVNSGATSGNVSVPIYFDSGISSINGQSSDLILDGTNLKESTITKVTDGNGKVRVVKEGSGTWVLGGGESNFTGGIDVQCGKLILRAPAGKFTWFRWTIRQLFLQDAGSGENEVQLNEFGLYDAAGKRINGELRHATDRSVSAFDELHYPMLLPGEVAYGKPVYSGRYNANGKRELEKMFDDVNLAPNSYDFCWNMIDSHEIDGTWTRVRPSESDETTWLKVLMRVDPTSNPVASYDYCGMLGGNCHRAPKSWILEGSTDGVTWWKLDEQSIAYSSRPWKDYMWIFSRTQWVGTGDAASHEGGRPINGTTNAVVVTYHGPISVADGAVLDAEGNVKIESLKVDALRAGTIRGVEFSANMELDLENLPDGGGDNILPLKIENCIGTESAEWTVRKSGKHTCNLSAMVMADGKLHVSCIGMRLILR